MEECGKDYVTAARSIGARDFRIIFLAILPNCLGPLIVQTTLSFASAILDAAALSFLGLTDPEVLTWGKMIGLSRDNFMDAPWTVTFPGLAIFFTAFCIALIGDGLNDAFNPKLRGR